MPDFNKLPKTREDFSGAERLVQIWKENTGRAWRLYKRSTTRAVYLKGKWPSEHIYIYDWSEEPPRDSQIRMGYVSSGYEYIGDFFKKQQSVSV